MIPIHRTKSVFTEGNVKYGIDESQCISGNIMPHLAHVAMLNFVEIHPSGLVFRLLIINVTDCQVQMGPKSFVTTICPTATRTKSSLC